MQRFFVTVHAPDGLLLVNKLMCDCETEQQARHAASMVAVRQIDEYDSFSTMLLFTRNLRVTVEKGN